MSVRVRARVRLATPNPNPNPNLLVGTPEDAADHLVGRAEALKG